MTLKEINKTIYSNHLRVIFVSMALLLMLLSVLNSTILIYLFSQPEQPHFLHNLAGVAAATFFVYVVLNKFRQHTYMYEVVYVWDLKQHLNRINRKLRKLEAAVENNDLDAIMIMHFMYQGSKQLYKLDDNTITLDSLIAKIEAHDQHMRDLGLSLTTIDFNPAMLDQF